MENQVVEQVPEEKTHKADMEVFNRLVASQGITHDIWRVRLKGEFTGFLVTHRHDPNRPIASCEVDAWRPEALALATARIVARYPARAGRGSVDLRVLGRQGEARMPDWIYDAELFPLDGDFNHAPLRIQPYDAARFAQMFRQRAATGEQPWEFYLHGDHEAEVFYLLNDDCGEISFSVPNAAPSYTQLIAHGDMLDQDADTLDGERLGEEMGQMVMGASEKEFAARHPAKK